MNLELRTRAVIHSLATNVNPVHSEALTVAFGRLVERETHADVYVALAALLGMWAASSPDPDAFCYAVAELAAGAAKEEPPQ